MFSLYKLLLFVLSLLLLSYGVFLFGEFELFLGVDEKDLFIRTGMEYDDVIGVIFEFLNGPFGEATLLLFVDVDVVVKYFVDDKVVLDGKYDVEVDFGIDDDTLVVSSILLLLE